MQLLDVVDRGIARRWAVAGGVATALIGPGAADAATFTGIGGLAAGERVRAESISGDGTTIVGQARDASGIDQAFRWRSDTGLVSLGFPAGSDPSSSATGVSSDGAVVVGGGNPDRFSSSGQEAFRWTEAGGYELIGSSTGTVVGSTSATEVSANGNIIAGSINDGGLDAARFNYSNSNWINLDTLPGLGDTHTATDISDDASVMVGQAINPNGRSVAFRATGTFLAGLGFLGDEEATSDSLALAVSGDGSTTVGLSTKEGFTGEYPFMHTLDDGMTELGIPGSATEATPWDVSLDGSVIVGTSFFGQDLNPARYGVVWTEEAGPRLLQDLLLEQGAGENGELDDWRIDHVYGVADDGLTFTGTMLNTTTFVTRSFIATLDTLALPVELDGDYNGDGFVSQADLDLVLLNWGDSVIPPEWVATDQFDGVQVSQNELDGVLLNWGDGTPPSIHAIPEPGAFGVVGAMVLGALGHRQTLREHRRFGGGR